MIDIQNSVDEREIPLKKVGVRNVEYPVAVLDKKNKIQNTTATLDLFVTLPHHFKGTHMSRFIEVFHKYRKDISINHFTEMLEEIRNKLTAERAFGKITFPYFIEKEAPVSKSKGFIKYTCTYEAEVSDKEKKFYLEVKVPVTTLCPCSKAISDYGAHNQRGTVTVKVLYRDFFWLEDLIEAVEKSASSPLYSVLKRQDEKYVTEHAYDTPRFVEDVVREVYIALKEFEGGGKFSWFSVEAENEESIHAHNAYAYTECNL